LRGAGTRFQPEHHALDQAAFAGGIPAVDADHGAAAGPQVVNLQVEQAVLQGLQAPVVVPVVERTVDHVDLVQRRPLAHRFPPRRIVPERERD
jgi:hypothetical protein